MSLTSPKDYLLGKLGIIQPNMNSGQVYFFLILFCIGFWKEEKGGLSDLAFVREGKKSLVWLALLIMFSSCPVESLPISPR